MIPFVHGLLDVEDGGWPLVDGGHGLLVGQGGGVVSLLLGNCTHGNVLFRQGILVLGGGDVGSLVLLELGLLDD